MGLDCGVEAKSKLEYGHVAYIKLKDNMVANILPIDTPSTSWVGSKGKKKVKVVVLHIKSGLDPEGLITGGH